MRITFVISNVSVPAKEGLHEQNLLLAEALVRAGNDVSVLALCRNSRQFDASKLPPPLQSRVELWPIPARVPALLLGLLGSMGLWGKQIRRRLDESALGPEPSFTILEGVAAAGTFRKRMQRTTIVSLVDPPSRRQFRLARSAIPTKSIPHFLAGGISYVLESALAARRAAVHFVSSSDTDYARERRRFHRAITIPVMVLTEDRPASIPAEGTQHHGSQIDLLVVADLRQSHMRRAVQWLFEEVLPQAPTSFAAKIRVVGRVAPRLELTRAATSWDVEFTEWVPDLIALMRSSKVVIVPDLVGTGLKNRSVLALLSGTPTIGTPTAFEGIAVEHLVTCLVAEIPAEFASGIEMLLSNEVLRSTLGSAAAELAASQFSAQTVAAQWVEALTQNDQPLASSLGGTTSPTASHEG